jgi:predicted RNA-binding protein YlqC (UPF0109 family)
VGDFMQELVRYLVTQLVGESVNVDIEMIEGSYASEIVITAEKADIGKIIGKQGRIAKAIRTIVRAASAKENKKYSVTINEK